MRRSWAERAAAAGLALALAGCGLGGGSGDGEPKRGAAKSPAPAARANGAGGASTPAQQLDALLATRSAALQRGDARAYAGTATGAQQRATDRRSARQARGLGLERVAFTVDELDLGRRRATLKVRSLYGIRGVPGRFSGTRTLVAVRTARGWRVARESSPRERHPWELGPVARRSTRHFVVLGPAALAGAPQLADALERGYTAVREALPDRPPPRRLLAIVAPTTRDAGRLTVGIRGVERLAAITDSRVREAGPERRADEVVSQRLLVSWPVFGGLVADERVRIVTHELTHAALAGTTSGRTPAWLIEGFALYTSGDQRVQEAAADLAGPSPPSLRGGLARADGIARASGAQQGESYAYASAAAFYLAERFGPRAALRLYAAFNRPSIRGGPGPRTTDRALRATLGISLARFERDLRRWIADRAAS